MASATPATTPAASSTPAAIDDPQPYTVCQTGNYIGWVDLLYCIEPVTCVYIGVGIVLGFSIIGAAW